MTARSFFARTLLPLFTMLLALAALPAAAQNAACVDNLAARAKTGTIQLTWTHVPGTIRYDVERATALAGPFGALGSTTSTVSTYLNSPVANATTYYYRIHRIFAGGDCYSGVIAAIAPAARSTMAQVPSLLGDLQADALAELAAASLQAGTVGSAHSDTVGAGRVLSQDPPAGSSVPVSTPVAFVVSDGPAPPANVLVPNVVNLTQAAATAAITGAGLVVGTVGNANSNVVPAGSVISQSPGAGSSVLPGSAVNLTVSTGPAQVAVPDVVSLTQAAAEAAITGAGLVVGTVTNANSNTVPSGSVISQNPVAGTSVAPGSAVSLVVSTGPANVTVPSVVSFTQAAASAAIVSAGLVVGTVTNANSNTVPSGSVISQNPAGGASVAPGSAVALVVSIGPANVSVPNVVNLTQAAATTALTNAGLALGTVTQANSNTVPSGSVISQNPAAGASVAPGSAVSLVVSTGPALVSVPNVVNLTQAAASAAITGAGLVVGTVGTANSNVVPAGSVISQSPGAGSSVLPGSAVNLTVSTGPAQVAVPNVVNLTQAAASAAITGAGLVVGTVTNASSNTVPSGSVISQNPTAGTNVSPGSAVSLVVSIGPANVTVPNVVNLTQAAATTAITGAGLVVGNVTQANSNTVPAGSVISQNPAAGASVSPGAAVDLVVSLGPAGATPAALNLRLNQLVTGAGSSLTVTPTVLDGGGNPIAAPPTINYEILFDAASTVGTIPGINGSSVVTGTDTRGSFTLRGTVAGTSVSAQIRFTVLQNATQSSNAGLYVALSAAQSSIADNIAAIGAALQSGNTGAIAPASAALTAAAATVRINSMSVASAYAPDTGFVPRLSQIQGRYPATAADTNFRNLTTQIRTKIQQIVTLLNTPTGNDANDTATLQQYSTELQALTNNLQLAANTPTINGVVANAEAVDALVSKDMPRITVALANRVNAQLRANGYIARQGGPTEFYRLVGGSDSGQLLASASQPAAMYAGSQPVFLLTGLLGYAGNIGGLIQRIYGPFLDQVQKMYILLAAQGLLNQFLTQTASVGALVTGGSQSFHAYHMPDSVIEVSGVSLADAQSSDVFLIGGNAVNTVEGLIDTLGDVSNIHSIQDLYNFYQAVLNQMQAVGEAYDLAHQQPNFFIGGEWPDACLMSGSGYCVEYHYNSGFNYVGSGGPVSIEPVIVLVRVSNPTQPQYGSGIFNFAGR